MDYLNVEEARERGGLRLVLCAGVPGVWGEAVKAMLHVKGIDYTPVAQSPGGENPELEDWTGQSSAPVVAYEEERIRTTWESFIWLAERLVPDPPLIPADPTERALMFGLTREIAGENGLGWCRRLQSIHASGGPEADPGLARLARKYGYDEQPIDAVDARAAGILRLLTDRMKQQRERGSDYYIGERLTALDLYSAVFIAVMVKPMAPETIPMPEGMRFGFSAPCPSLDAAADPVLFEHRDHVFEHHIPTPLSF